MSQLFSQLFLERISIRQEAQDFQNSYLSQIPALRGLEELVFHQRITFLVGENGTGKSTLLEAMAAGCGLNPEGGSRNFHFSTSDTHSSLYRAVKLSRGPYRPKNGFFLRAESFYNAATYIDELDRQAAASPQIKESYGGKSLHCQSHGESFFALVQNRFGEKGLYFLDEPEAALSPSRQMALLARIHELSSSSQFIIATHSPILIACPGAEVLSLDGGKIAPIPYQETEQYKLTLRFLQNPEKMLRFLLEEEGS